MAGFRSILLVLLVASVCLGPPMCVGTVTVTTVAQSSTIEGADVQLTCTYNPHTTPTDFGYLAWSKDGTTLLTYACEQTCGLQESAATQPGKYALNVDTTSSGNLTIYGAGLDDEATYMCSVLTSDLVVYSSTTQLTVDVPVKGLVISDFRTSSYTNNSVVRIQVDQSYQFRCSLTLPSKPRVTIEWQGERIDTTMDAQVDEPTDGGLVTSYRIVHVTPGMQDSGKVLRCLATHPTTGQEVVSTVVLDVQVCPSSVLIHECPTAITSGDSASLGCRSAATSPPPVLYWLYEGSRVENTSSEFGSRVAEDGANVITYTRQFGMGDFNKDFVCCIERTSMCSQLCSEPCLPDILYPPSDVAVHSSIALDSVTEGTRDLVINCTANGNPMGPSHISWMRIDEAGNAIGIPRNAPLRFDAVSRSDAGMYRCTVNNGVGPSRSAHIKIIVYHAPNVSNDQDHRAHGNEGDAAWLTCTAESNPKPTITWYTPDNRTITEPSPVITSEIQQTDYSIRVTSKLHVSNIDPAMDYGRYRCQAGNDVGTAELFVTLRGKSKPFPPTAVHFNQIATTDTSLTVTWQPGHDGGADQTFTVTSCLVGANQKCSVNRGITGTRFEITNLQAYSWYDVTVTGVNIFGESEASRPGRNSTSPLSPVHLGVVATYDITTGYIHVSPKSNDTRPLPDDLCFGLEVKVIVSRREEVCLKLNDRFHVETELSESQIWVVSCGRGVCSDADHVRFPPLSVESTSPESNDLDITSLVAIVAGAVVCLVVILIVFAAWKWSKKRGSMLHKQMSSRKLPTLPRGNGCSPPSQSCQEAMESQVYDGLEMGSMNPYMHPYAQSTLPSKAPCAPPTTTPPNSDLQCGNDISLPPPDADKVKQNHLEGTYTTTLSYVPMGSPTVLHKTERKPSSQSEKIGREPEFLSPGNSNMDHAPENTDVETALLVDIGEHRTSPSESDEGYYSVPKSTPVTPIDETTPVLAAC